jgi:D-alanyl-D-alanine carboxypeptidase (penicillin-binding protein 5/6)
MKNSQFNSVHGLPPSAGQQPDITTARDLAILCRELAKRPEALKYTGTQTRGFREDKFIMHNHNKLLTRFPGCDGFKTGYYEAAGFSVAATAKKGGVRIITLVMGSRDRKVRDAKTAELMSKGFTLVPPQPAVTTAATPKPAVAPPQQTATAAAPSTPVQPAAVAATAPVPAEQQGTGLIPAATAGGSGWGKILIGIGIGFVLCLGFFIVVDMLRKNRTKHKMRF